MIASVNHQVELVVELAHALQGIDMMLSVREKDHLTGRGERAGGLVGSYRCGVKLTFLQEGGGFHRAQRSRS
jgi:hypothetical protein